MAENNKFGGWTSILDAVRTPLGFFTLIALILDGVLLATAGLTEEVPMWAPIGLLGLLVAGVFVIVWVKPDALYRPKTVTVSLLFPIEAIEVDLDIEQCTLEIRDERGRKRRAGTPNLTFGFGGWSFQLPQDVKPSDSVRLELVESNGRRWKVNPLAPYEIAAQALEVN